MARFAAAATLMAAFFAASAVLAADLKLPRTPGKTAAYAECPVTVRAGASPHCCDGWNSHRKSFSGMCSRHEVSDAIGWSRRRPALKGSQRVGPKTVQLVSRQGQCDLPNSISAEPCILQATNASPATLEAASCALTPPPIRSASVSQPFVVAIEESVSEGARPIVSGTTNLPDGTQLTILIRKPRLPNAEERLGVDLAACGDDCSSSTATGTALGGVAVKNGQFRDGPFTDKGDALSPGTYVLEIMIPEAASQPPGVLAIIGPRGENMTGPLVGACCLAGAQGQRAIENTIDEKLREAPIFGASIYYARYVEINPNPSTEAFEFRAEAKGRCPDHEDLNGSTLTRPCAAAEMVVGQPTAGPSSAGPTPREGELINVAFMLSGIDAFLSRVANQVVGLTLMEQFHLLAVVWGAIHIVTNVSWPRIRANRGTRIIYHVCTAFVVALSVFKIAGHLLRLLVEFQEWHFLATEVGIVVVACVVGLILYQMHGRRWTWTGVFRAYVTPILSVSFLSHWEAVKAIFSLLPYLKVLIALVPAM
jgi:hypothetical protein